MRKTIICLLLLPVFVSCLAGCVPLVVGGAVGAVGGYAVSKDTVQGDTDKSYDSLWNAAQEEVSLRGKIKKDDFSKGYMEGVAQDSSLIWIRITRLTHTASRVRISCRRFHLPNLALAQDLFVKIIEGAK